MKKLPVPRDLRPITIPFANYLVNIQAVIFLVYCELCWLQVISYVPSNAVFCAT